jgi:tryptophanyl-tRNA synthetase
MSLQNPTLKMSKSHPDPRSRILITDSPSTIQRKIMSALTDSTNSVSYDPVNRPGVSNLLQLLAHFDAEGRSAEELGRVHGGTGMGLKAFKTLVAETIGGKLESIRTTFERVMREGNGGYLDEVEKRGGERARESAEATMSVVREAVGL